MSETLWVKQTYRNLLRAEFGFQPEDKVTRAQLATAVRRICGETLADVEQKASEVKGGGAPNVREILEAAMGIRWGCATSSLRSMFAGRRRPTVKSNPKFFDDLAKYGAAQFNKTDGAVIKNSLGKGPSVIQFLQEVAPGRDIPRAESAA